MFSFGPGFWEKLNIKGTLNSANFDKYGASHSVKEIKVGKSVTTIDTYAFSDGMHDGVESQLTNVDLPETNILLKRYAFNRCSNLYDIHIPKNASFESMDVDSDTYDVTPFRGCILLNNIDVDPDNEKYKSENGMVLTKDGTGLVCGVTSTNGSAEIPDGVRVINKDAFAEYDLLTSVYIPNSVEKIGKSAFQGCHHLETLMIPDSVSRIEEYAFCGAESLQSVTIGNGITYIGENAFIHCNQLTYMSIDRPKAYVQAMYPGNWGLKRGTVIHCNDGDITI